MSLPDGTFVSQLRDDLQGPFVHETLTGQRVLAPGHWKEFPKQPPPAPAAIVVSTLTGLRDYLAANIDVLQPNRMMLHVASPTRVFLVGPLEGEIEHFRRMCLVQSQATPPQFKFDQYYDSESFFVSVQTMFVDTPVRAKLLEFVASVRDEAVLETVDDGVSQLVNTARGVKVAREKVPTPLVLQPFRTFNEVPQPESPFVLRMKAINGDRPHVALFEADGGAWKLGATRNIAAWLRSEISAVAVVA